ncbi:MAG TPA: hypothetical protein K8U77_08265 [Slackia equolifaciens]|uniref:Uncharacterized protein n=1 Tax=Slackia equolifaciens TaxID=498718 RepID=A0A9D2UXX0_9ACTN|nr:hypothetical protein [Slackia equolifaciens]
MAGETQAVTSIALHALLLSDAKKRAACGGVDQAPGTQKRAHRYRPQPHKHRSAPASAPLLSGIHVDPQQHQRRSSAALTSIRDRIKSVPRQHRRRSANERRFIAA